MSSPIHSDQSRDESMRRKLIEQSNPTVVMRKASSGGEPGKAFSETNQQVAPTVPAIGTVLNQQRQCNVTESVATSKVQKKHDSGSSLGGGSGVESQGGELWCQVTSLRRKQEEFDVLNNNSFNNSHRENDDPVTVIPTNPPHMHVNQAESSPTENRQAVRKHRNKATKRGKKKPPPSVFVPPSPAPLDNDSKSPPATDNSEMVATLFDDKNKPDLDIKDPSNDETRITTPEGEHAHPGAYFVTGLPPSQEASVDLERGTLDDPGNNQEIEPTRSNDEILVEANLVQEQEESNTTSLLVEAKPLEDRRWWMCRIITLVVIVTAIAVSLGVTLTRPPPFTMAPTPIPTPPPTPRPTNIYTNRFYSKLANDTRLAIKNTTSPQGKAYVWVTSTEQPSFAKGEQMKRMKQRFALATLYYSTEGRSTWTNTSGWLDYNSSECDWAGCGCSNVDNTIVSLQLDSNGLDGNIPMELGLLTSLTDLFVSYNTLRGSIPTQLSQMRKLQFLSFRDNALSGMIPTELGVLSSLSFLDLSQSSSLSGTIPSEIGRLSRLTYLDFTNNALTGEIPNSLGSLNNVTALLLGSNQLLGRIPAALSRLSQVTTLALEDNHLTGSIPRELGSLTSLQQLSLMENSISGPIPVEFGQLTSLTELALSVNNLTASIPTSLGLLGQLTFLDLSLNNFKGTIPTEIGRLTQLFILRLNNNSLTGQIPPALGKLSRLGEINLFNNSFNGSVPSTLCTLAAKNVFDVKIDCRRVVCNCTSCACSENSTGYL